MRGTLFAIGAALLGIASPAAAQPGVLWSGGNGQTIELGFSGVATPPIAAVNRPVAEMAALFKQLCVDTDGVPAAIGAVATGQGFDAQPIDLSPTKKEAAVHLPIWRGRGVTVAQTHGFSQVPLAQCSITFLVAAPPSPAEIADAASALFGAQPVNAATAFKKNGKPNKNYCPEWTIAGTGGTERIAAAVVMTANRFDPSNRVQLSLRARKAD